jgi:hypothetical protein
MASIPNKTDSAIPNNSENRSTALKEIGAKLKTKMTPKYSTKPNSMIN